MSADGHDAYTYEIGQRVKWFERGTGTWYPALIRERERRHDGATYYKVFSTTGSNFWTQQQHLQPNKTPVFVKGAQVHWLRQRDRKWLEATVTNDNNARLNEYEIIVTGTDEHKQTVTERLRPATARLHTPGTRVWVRSARTGHHPTQATIMSMLPVGSYQPPPFASGLPYTPPHTNNINYMVKLPDGTTVATAQTDIESDTSWHHTRAKQLSTPELTAAELTGRCSVDV